MLALGDSFHRQQPDGLRAAAAILVVKALLTPAMREAEPERAFPGYTRVEDLAAAVVRILDDAAGAVNARRLDLTTG